MKSHAADLDVIGIVGEGQCQVDAQDALVAGQHVVGCDVQGVTGGCVAGAVCTIGNVRKSNESAAVCLVSEVPVI